MKLIKLLGGIILCVIILAGGTFIYDVKIRQFPSQWLVKSLYHLKKEPLNAIAKALHDDATVTGLSSGFDGVWKMDTVDGPRDLTPEEEAFYGPHIEELHEFPAICGWFWKSSHDDDITIQCMMPISKTIRGESGDPLDSMGISGYIQYTDLMTPPKPLCGEALLTEIGFSCRIPINDNWLIGYEGLNVYKFEQYQAEMESDPN